MPLSSTALNETTLKSTPTVLGLASSHCSSENRNSKLLFPVEELPMSNSLQLTGGEGGLSPGAMLSDLSGLRIAEVRCVWRWWLKIKKVVEDGDQHPKGTASLQNKVRTIAVGLRHRKITQPKATWRTHQNCDRDVTLRDWRIVFELFAIVGLIFDHHHPTNLRCLLL
jgi:hypothetical protein